MGQSGETADVNMGCPACGAKLPAGSRFCRNCGESLVQKSEVARAEETPEAKSPTPLRPKNLLLLAILLVGFGGALLVVRSLQGDSAENKGNGSDTASTSAYDDLPEPTTGLAQTILNQLDGKYALLQTMHGAAESILRSAGRQTCQSTVDRLNASASPDNVLAAAAGIPDAPLREGLFREREALGVALTACVAGSPETRLRDLRAAVYFVDARLTQLEAAR